MDELFVKSKLGCRCELENGEVTIPRLKIRRAQWNCRSLSVNVLSIVDASREQSTKIKEINQAVSQMDQGTQKNAAMVEEIHRRQPLSCKRSGNPFRPHRKIRNRRPPNQPASIRRKTLSRPPVDEPRNVLILKSRGITRNRRADRANQITKRLRGFASELFF